jgi:type IV pilus assembly protein PilF
MPEPIKSRTNSILLFAKIRLLVLLPVFIIISGCASSQSYDSNGESMSRKAAESNTSLGLKYMERGQHEVALGKLKKAINEDPGYAPAHTVMAILYERIGEVELAGEHYLTAYKADPEDGDVNNNYGVYLCQRGEESKAIGHFEIALDDPFYRSPPVALTNAGSCALSQGQMATANEYLRRALKIAPNFPDALMTMARMSYRQQNFLSARAFLQRYEAVASHRPDSLLIAYKIETASNNSEAATKYLLTLETNFPDSNQTAEVRRISGK